MDARTGWAQGCGRTSLRSLHRPLPSVDGSRSKGTTSSGLSLNNFLPRNKPSGSDVAAMAGRECRVVRQIPAPLPTVSASTKPCSACQPPCLHFGQAFSTPLQPYAPTWHARSRRRPRILMFPGVSLQINDSPRSGMEAQAFRRVWKRKPPEPALCARAQHVIVPLQC